MPTNVFDNTFPPDTQLANLLGQDIRTFKLDIQERMALISGTLAGRWNPGADTQPAKWTGLLYFATDTQQLFQWSGAAWVQIPFTGGVIAAFNLTGQNAAIASTLFYAVPASGAGIYRASIDLVLTTDGSGGQIGVAVQWTNDGGVGNGTVVNSINLGVGVGNEVDLTGGVGGIKSSLTFPSSCTFYSAASQNINYRTTFTSVSGSPVYSLRGRLEFLG